MSSFRGPSFAGKIANQAPEVGVQMEGGRGVLSPQLAQGRRARGRSSLAPTTQSGHLTGGEPKGEPSL